MSADDDAIADSYVLYLIYFYMICSRVCVTNHIQTLRSDVSRIFSYNALIKYKRAVYIRAQ